MRSVTSTFSLLLVSFWVTLTMAINGSLLTMIQKSFGLNYASLSLIFSMMLLGIVITTLPSASLAKRYGTKPPIVVALFGVSIALTALAFLTNLAALYIAWFIIGLLFGPLITLFQSALSDLNDQQSGRVLTLSAMMASLGALAAPVLTKIVVINLSISWQWVYGLLAVGFSAIGLLNWIFVPSLCAPDNQKHNNRLHALVQLLHNRDVLRFTSVAAIAAAIEWTFSFWLITYLVQTSFADMDQALSILSVFYVVMLVSRFFISIVGSARFARPFLFCASMIGLLGALMFLLTARYFISTGLVAFALAGMYPLGLSEAVRTRAGSSAQVSSVVVEVVYLVSMMLPLIAGLVSDTGGIALGLAIALLGFVPLAVFLFSALNPGSENFRENAP